MVTLGQGPSACSNWIYDNKVVVTLESPISPNQAINWIWAFKEEHDIKLVLHDELFNALFAMQFDIHTRPSTRKDPLALLPIKAINKYTTFHYYYSGFDPYKLVNLCHSSSHLVVVYI